MSIEQKSDAPLSATDNGTPLREGVPLGQDREPVLVIQEEAKQRIRAVLEAQDPPVATIRVSAPYRGRYAMNLEPDGEPAPDDVVLPYEGFRVFVDPQSLPFVDGATLQWVDTPTGGGFQFVNPNDAPRRPTPKEPPAGPEGDVWRQIQQILDEEINPYVAMHGGHIGLIEYRDGVAYVLMSGGCQGCGMANVTLRQGVERILKDRIPELREVLDVTDHAEGRNPYYAPSTK